MLLIVFLTTCWLGWSSKYPRKKSSLIRLMLQKSLLSSSWLVDFCLYDLLQGLGVFQRTWGVSFAGSSKAKCQYQFGIPLEAIHVKFFAICVIFNAQFCVTGMAQHGGLECCCGSPTHVEEFWISSWQGFDNMISFFNALHIIYIN